MKLKEFQYDLPENRIAKQPISPRDHSKLLEFSDGQILHHHFYELSQLLPSNTQLVVNNAKVIPARLSCIKNTGAVIEVFLLEPIEEYQQVFIKENSVQWKVMVGNKKRWKAEQFITTSDGTCQLKWINRELNIVELNWTSGESFSVLLDRIGNIPIPPYLNRESKPEDEENYQTTYAAIAGSVAAPTAGLHFTPAVLDSLTTEGIEVLNTTLHVGAGTFKPVVAEDIKDHQMHAEQFELRLEFVEGLIAHKGPRVAVGTTSLRVLESLYQIGVNILNGIKDPQHVLQDQQASGVKLNYKESLLLVKKWLEDNGDCLASTAIFIYPGKKVRSIDAIITNFHQPGSSLVMLISCLIGDEWRRVYQCAMENEYRFLSYGDSSLLWLNN